MIDMADIAAIFGLDHCQGQIVQRVIGWKQGNGIAELETAARLLEKYIALERARIEGTMHIGILRAAMIRSMKQLKEATDLAEEREMPAKHLHVVPDEQEKGMPDNV